MEKTTKIKLIEEYYAILGKKLLWNPVKVRELCNHSQITLDELAALMRLTKKGLESRMRNGFNKQDSLLLYQIAVNKGYYTPLP